MVVRETCIPALELYGRGKVRDIYNLGDYLLIVATDRLSAFDVVLPTAIPDKGKVLTQMSTFWFEFSRDVVSNHLVSTRVEELPSHLQPYRRELEGRSMLVRKASVFPIECVVRGYIAGSGWKDYQETGGVCGISLPSGMRESDRLEEPIFTPSTKAQSGHDENISLAEAAGIIGSETVVRLRDLSIDIYRRAVDYAATKDILICDTKFEFGTVDGEIVVIDEMLTPDSSRLWPAEHYKPGRAQPSLDKQFVRDYLEKVGWDKKPPAPRLPPDVVRATSGRYVKALRQLTGRELA